MTVTFDPSGCDQSWDDSCQDCGGTGECRECCDIPVPVLCQRCDETGVCPVCNGSGQGTPMPPTPVERVALTVIAVAFACLTVYLLTQDDFWLAGLSVVAGYCCWSARK